jgi:hypothetical protein
MCDDGLLVRNSSSNFARATTYSINLDRVRQPTANGQQPTVAFDVRQSPAYHELQGMPHFRQRARIDARLWVGEPPEGTLGPIAQRIIATLQTFAVSQSMRKVETINSRGTTPLHDCLNSAHTPSMSSLWRLAGVSARAGEQVFKALVSLGVCSWEYGTDGKAKIPHLTDNWYERLHEFAPALTTYGHDVLLAHKYDLQRIVHHEQLSKRSKGDKRQLHRQAAGNASGRLAQHEQAIDALNAKRRAWAASQGIVGDIPHISLHGPAKPKRIQQPVAAQGRKVIPTGRIHVGPNRPTMQGRVVAYTWEQALKRLHRLLETPAPNEREQREANALAARLNVPLTWQRLDLNSGEIMVVPSLTGVSI